MSEKVKFEIQVENKNFKHGWRLAGGRDGWFYFNENERVPTVTRTVEQARQAIEMLRTRYYEPEMLKMPEHRIVKITVTTTYDVVE